MLSVQKPKEIPHYPNLKTILMVENVLKHAEVALKRSEIKRRLPVKIMHQTLNVIIDYLDENGKILEGPKGIIWAYNPSLKMREATRRAEIETARLRKLGYDL